MAGLRDMPLWVNVLLAVAVALLLVGAGLYIPGSPLQTQAAELEASRKEIDKLQPEVLTLRVVERQHAELKQQIAAQEKQLDVLKAIVPEDKEVDEFLRMIHASAVQSGVELRRVTARSVNALEYHNELPFDVEFDGPYWNVMNFFGRMGRLSRIINVSDLTFQGPDKAVQSINKYQIQANHTVIATCTVTTFFTKLSEADRPAAKTAKGKQPGKPAPAKR
jgi:type IV pilus assembly protein PilO